jgi:uncharacterized protein
MARAHQEPRRYELAATSLLALLDDIATVLDDVATMTKVAAKKTAGVLGDDLALNAQQVTGVAADRELPVVWAVAKGSVKNKLILVPVALLISTLAAWAITPLLMLGGAFLCFEGFEKLAHRFLRPKAEDEARQAELLASVADLSQDMVARERGKIAGAVRTDFILSAEIITIALGTVAQASLPMRMAVLLAVSALMTVGVYGLVAGIVKLDDGAVRMTATKGEGPGARLVRGLGALLLRATPWLMRTLSVVGTAAMFMVGGGILSHGLPAAHTLSEHVAHRAAEVPVAGAVFRVLAPLTLDAALGILAGALVLAGWKALGRLWGAVRDRTTGPKDPPE